MGTPGHHFHVGAGLDKLSEFGPAEVRRPPVAVDSQSTLCIGADGVVTDIDFSLRLGDSAKVPILNSCFVSHIRQQ